MTGQGAASASVKGVHVEVTLASVNRKQLELLVAVPRELAALEPEVQGLLRSRLVRGRVMGEIRVSAPPAAAGASDGPLPDPSVAARLIAALRKIAAENGLEDDLSASDLLAIPDFIPSAAPPPPPSELVRPALLAAVTEALDRLVAFRRREGAVLAVDLLRRLDAMAVLHEAMAARAPAEAEAARRYFFVPWDYDKTFREEIPPRDYSNTLHRRLRNEIPGFREGLVQRWRALRAHPFATETLLAKLDAEASFLAPYMAFEYELLNLQELDYDQEVDILRNEVQRHLRWMDRWISNQENQL